MEPMDLVTLRYSSNRISASSPNDLPDESDYRRDWTPNHRDFPDQINSSIGCPVSSKRSNGLGTPD